MNEFLQSDYVSMYPSALRGGTDTATQTATIFNPESRLSSEFNLTNSVNRLTINGSFVIDYSGDNIEFSIHGYYFKLSGVSSLFSSANDGDIYASIQLSNIAQNSSYSLLSLTAWGGTSGKSTNLDVQNGSAYEFRGVKIGNTDLTNKSQNIYSLKILNKNGSNYTVPDSSLLKFDPKAVQIVDTTSLASVIYKNSDGKLEVSVDEFKGHLTGNVTGDLDGNAKTAADSSYAAKYGTSTQHPAIGTNLKHVYVDSNGIIQQSNATVGGYKNATSQFVYFDQGEIKAGTTINVASRAPVNGSDTGKEGDIWFQYVG